MSGYRRILIMSGICGLFVCAFALGGGLAGADAQERSFPFEKEMYLDADPVRGSKRVPGLQISSDGEMEIDLWCVSGAGRATIAGNSITIAPTAMRDNQCPPERLMMDKELLDKLAQVTNWRWEGHVLVLVGPQSLRYRPASN